MTLCRLGSDFFSHVKRLVEGGRRSQLLVSKTGSLAKPMTSVASIQ